MATQYLLKTLSLNEFLSLQVNNTELSLEKERICILNFFEHTEPQAPVLSQEKKYGNLFSTEHKFFYEEYNFKAPLKLNQIQKNIAKIIEYSSEWNLNQTKIFITIDERMDKKTQTEIIEQCFFVLGYKNFIFEYSKNDSEEVKFISKNKVHTKKQTTVEFCFLKKNLGTNFFQEILSDEVSVILKNSTQATDGVNWARRLAELPGNVLTPEKLVLNCKEFIEQHPKSSEVNINILNETQLQEQGFGGVLYVGNGSVHKPFVGVFHRASKHKNAKTIALVGKGITFDTGGYSIKPKQFHNEMKYDMCGSVNIVAAFTQIISQREDLNVVCVVACAENMVSATAGRPGDVYTSYNGTTIDVYNTDAEGRLVLADLFSYVQEKYSPNYMIDMGTLTGGTSSIAGNLAGILMGNSPEHLASFKSAGSLVAEPWLTLEILPECLEDMAGTVSDLTNMNHRWSTGAPTMHAAAFLQNFVTNSCVWIHLDIASMAYKARNKIVFGDGANGFGAMSVARWVCTL
jgi:leucyl aminopeptidase